MVVDHHFSDGVGLLGKTKGCFKLDRALKFELSLGNLTAALQNAILRKQTNRIKALIPYKITAIYANPSLTS
jgi:hypothetical protein